MELLEKFLELLPLLQSAGTEVLVNSALVLVFVFALRLIAVLPNSNSARIANLVLSTMLSGILTSPGNSAEGAYILVLTSTFSGLLWDGLAHLYEKLLKKEKPFISR